MESHKKYLKYKIKYLWNLIKNNQKGGSYSNVYAFNKLNNIIERLSYKLFNDKIHIIIDDDVLVKLSNKNDMKIKKIYIKYFKL
jgi:hypothetical protein